jgi:hypothetical protein
MDCPDFFGRALKNPGNGAVHILNLGQFIEIKQAA